MSAREAATPMMTGRYRDVITGPDGARVRSTPWRPNLVVDDAFRLLAALLRRDPQRGGIAYWAVGEGVPGWDLEPPATAPDTTRLDAERHRLAVPADAFDYVDGHGDPTPDPTSELQVRMTFEWPDEDVTLREFGLFGGDAGETPDSGIMMNHVVHPRIDLPREHRLTRHLRLTLGRRTDRRWLEVATHWLGATAVRFVDGVGEDRASALTAAGFTTVQALAGAAPGIVDDEIRPLRLLELRAKARLMLDTAAGIHPPEDLHQLTVSQVLRGTPSVIATEAGVSEVEVLQLREQLAALELTLDHRFLGPLTVRAVAGSGS